MKNKVEPWEEGLAGQMKEHEFAFDPAAMAGFESLLAAENTVAGESAPAEGVTSGAAKSGGLFSGKVLSIVLGTLLAGGLLSYLFWPGTTETIVAEPTIEVGIHLPQNEVVSTPATPVPAVASERTEPQNQTLHPAAAAPVSTPKTPATTSEATDNTLRPVDMIGGRAPERPTDNRSVDLPRPRPTSGTATQQSKEVRALALSPIPLAKPRWISPVVPIALPTVTIELESAKQARDRNALFPEVIDN